MGPCLVVSHGKSLHSKQGFIPLMWAQLHILQNLFSLATHPTLPLGHKPLCIRGHFSQAIPQTPILIFNHSLVLKKLYRLINNLSGNIKL
jgi:hypothetical protein